MKKRSIKGSYIPFAKSDCPDGNRFGYSLKLTRLLLKTTKRLFQLFPKYVKNVESKCQCRLNPFKKPINVFSNTGDFVFKVLTHLMITKTFKTVIYPCEIFYFSSCVLKTL